MAHSPARATYNRGDGRQFENGFARRPAEPDRLLPSIRELVPPEFLDLPIRSRDAHVRVPSPGTPPLEAYEAGPPSPSAYSYSPRQSKRQRLSFSESRDERRSHVPRLYTTPQRETSPSPRPARSIWTPTQPNPRGRQLPDFPPMRESVPTEPYDHLVPASGHQRPPNADYGREPVTVPRVPVGWPDRGHPENDDYLPSHQNSGAAQGRPPQHPPSHYYGYPPPHPLSHPSHHHLPLPPHRSHSFSLGSAQHPEHRMPFSGGSGYGSGYPDYVREPSGMDMRAGEARPRRRRGNLPKDTTDKLRAWFNTHVEHPYPSEEVKQMLMRETGLQMSKPCSSLVRCE